MEKCLKSLHHVMLACFTLAVLVRAQDQSGFISIDCGMPAGSIYDDAVTGITYISDANFTDSGISSSISPDYQDKSLPRQLNYVRSFPTGKRNCYKLNPLQGENESYLIRASFRYGDYDRKMDIPKFDLYLGVNRWDTIELEKAYTYLLTEIIHIPSADYIFVCLVNTDNGIPFISALELRHLESSIYKTQNPSEALLLEWREDYGSTTKNLVRYGDDKYDRTWWPKNFGNYENISTLLHRIDKDAENSDAFRPPRAVMSTAIKPKDVGENLTLYWEPSEGINYLFYFYMHFYEVEIVDNQTREFNISVNGNFFYGPISPTASYLTVYTSKPTIGKTINFTLHKTERSTLPPSLNAMELYSTKYLKQIPTNESDVDSILKIKSAYGVKRNWQGDPCVPEAYRWDGVNCRYSANYPPRIISLSLASSGLTGNIAPYFANLRFIEHLDLSNNSLSGTVPEILSELPLKYLNLTRNELGGSLPAELMQKWKDGSLTLSADENPNICLLASCGRKKKKTIFPVVVSIASLCAVVLIALAIFCHLKRRKKQVVIGKVEKELANINQSFAPKNRQFTYSDVVRMTNNFQRVLGKGGFGTVYHGYLDDKQEVAVKMLSSSSTQGYKEFQAEVKLLVRAHHRNLTNLVGYCIEGANMGLIYEYMVKGNLQKYLSGKIEDILCWEDRMRIALDAAQGLEYLHNGCKPPIIHRDVKPSNILLNEKLEAKLADFGLSRIFPTEGGTHISTSVAGTPGYLDPEYSASNWLNEKSDVYSFGVVLLEIITCQPVIAKSMKNCHISQWVNFMIGKGDISNIVDPRLFGNFNDNSAWKALELALACSSHSASTRPTMLQVVIELKECLAMTNMDQNEEGRDQMVSVNLESEICPLAR